jgi:hypothetical protein
MLPDSYPQVELAHCELAGLRSLVICNSMTPHDDGVFWVLLKPSPVYVKNDESALIYTDKKKNDEKFQMSI